MRDPRAPATGPGGARGPATPTGAGAAAPGPPGAGAPGAGSPPSRAEIARGARGALVLSVAVTAALYAVPQARPLAWPFLLLSTLVHEMGHGIAAVLVGGRFEEFRMWADGSGVAVSSGAFGRLDHALVAAGGLLGPAVAAAVLFALTLRPRLARLALSTLGGLLVLAEILLVRSLFGLAFVALLAAGCILLARFGSAVAIRLTLAFAAVQLALSVFSRGDYLFTRTAQTAAGPALSDTGKIAQALLLPFWFWGAACGALSLAVLAGGLWLLLRPSPPGSP